MNIFAVITKMLWIKATTNCGSQRLQMVTLWLRFGHKMASLLILRIVQAYPQISVRANAAAAAVPAAGAAAAG